MEPSFEEYANILKNFYHKMVKGHPNFLVLNKDFVLMVSELSKNDASSQLNRSMRRKRDRDDLSITGSVHSAARSQRSHRGATRGKSEYPFMNQSLKKVLIFAYMYYLVDSSNTMQFEMVENKAKFLIENITK